MSLSKQVQRANADRHARRVVAAVALPVAVACAGLLTLFTGPAAVEAARIAFAAPELDAAVTGSVVQAGAVAPGYAVRPSERHRPHGASPSGYGIDE